MGRVGISKHGRGNSKLLAYNQKPQPKLGQYGQALRRGLRQILQPYIQIKIEIATKFIIEMVIQIPIKININIYIYVYIYIYILRLLLSVGRGEAAWAHVDRYPYRWASRVLGSTCSGPLGGDILCTGVWVLSRFGLYVEFFDLVYMPCAWVL